MTNYIVPILLIFVLLYALSKKICTYDTFVKGAGKAVASAWSIFPYLLTILIMVQLLRVSGIAGHLAQLVSPAFRLVGIPPELAELMLIRPFTGSGSLALLNDIYTMYGGPDTYISRCASVVMGSSETIFYVAAVYFSGSKVKRLLYTVPVALIASTVGAIIACLLCRFM